MDENIKKILEALLIVANEPLNSQDLAKLLSIKSDKIEAGFEDLASEYLTEQRGFELVEILPEKQIGQTDENSSKPVLKKWQLFSSPKFSEQVRSYLKDTRTQKLSIQALETLAIIAYRGPITRAQIQLVRGVNSDYIIRSLQNRDLVEETPKLVATAASKFRTTPYFLNQLGISSLEELFPIAPYLPENDQIDLSERDFLKASPKDAFFAELKVSSDQELDDNSAS